MKSFTIEHVLIIFNPSSLIYYKKTCIFIGFTVPAVYLWAETSSGHFPKLGGGGAGGGGGGVSGICGGNKVSQTFESIFENSVKQSEFEHWSFVVRGRCSTHQAITTMATNENFPPYSNAILCLEGSL
jgi:hypothetical protein